MFFQAAKGFSAQRSGAEVLFLAQTQILTVVVIGALVSRCGYYVSWRCTILAKDADHDRRRLSLEVLP